MYLILILIHVHVRNRSIGTHEQAGSEFNQSTDVGHQNKGKFNADGRIKQRARGGQRGVLNFSVSSTDPSLLSLSKVLRTVQYTL